MKRRALIGFMIGFFCVTLAKADMLETRKEGILNGKILSENDHEVHFKDAKGRTLVIKKKDVLFVDKENSSKAIRQTTQKVLEFLKHVPGNIKKYTDQLTEKFIKKVSSPLNRSGANAKMEALSRSMDETSRASTALAKKNMKVNSEITQQTKESYGDSSSNKKKGRFSSLSN